MSSEQGGPGSPDSTGPEGPGGPAGPDSNGPESNGPGDRDGPDGARRRARAEPGQLELTDPGLMRALAHPLRLSLLEELSHAGTLTATQAGEILGETPANCAFHLRTLARYGLVEEAGGGRGRERPWRRAVTGFDLRTTQQDPRAAAAAGVLGRVWTGRTTERARASLHAKHSWPPGWLEVLGESQRLRYLTLAEAAELQDQLRTVLDRFPERNDNPAARPPGAMPVEMLLLSYPVLPPSAPDVVAGQDSPRTPCPPGA
ncbi:MAG: helix-turn-helix domain-containing protein [Streptosporangiaceae bacterium]